MEEILGYIAATFTTVSFLPQAVKVIKTKDTQSISLFMYLIFNIGIILWLLYGIFTKTYPIIIANVITVILSSTILWYKIKEK